MLIPTCSTSFCYIGTSEYMNFAKMRHHDIRDVKITSPPPAQSNPVPIIYCIVMAYV